MLQLEPSFAPVADVVSRGHSHSTREGRGLVTFAVAACCTGISFTGIVLALRRHNHLEKINEAACGFTVDLHLVISY